MTNSARREAFCYCAETCPAVDQAFRDAADELKNLIAEQLHSDAEQVLETLCEKVKEDGTERLRSALVQACADKQDVESERDELQIRVDNQNDEIADLQTQLEATTE